jgi:hypothetical protein
MIRYGITRHGDAFRAYLNLPDIDPARPDLIKSFLDFYVGTYESIEAVVHELADDVVTQDELDQWAAEGITLEDLVRATWDIVELGSRFYVFTK